MLQWLTFLALSLGPPVAVTNVVHAEGLVADAAGKPYPAAHVFLAETQAGIGIKPLLPRNGCKAIPSGSLPHQAPRRSRRCHVAYQAVGVVGFSSRTGCGELFSAA